MCPDMAQARLGELFGSETDDCPCGRPHRIPTLEADLRTGAFEQLPRMVDRFFPNGSVLCAADGNTWPAAGEAAVTMLRESGRPVDIHRVDPDSEPAHADRESVDALVIAIKGHRPAGLLAVGSGTINDICKSAATVTDCPLITVATAASMNGYPSAISALTDQGVKITEPCRPPVAIIADPEILSTAPARMAAAGFGDLLSKNASTADWLVGHHLFGEYFCGFSAAVAEAARINTNSPEGLSVLIEALLRSGLSMVLAGSSSPASGGEHLISHLWDMTAHWRGRSPALHGEQTGVATLISLGLYEKLLALDAGALRRRKESQPVAETPADFDAFIRKYFRDLADAVLPFARRKYLDGSALRQRRSNILSCWEKFRNAVGPVVIPAADSRSHLRAAGALWRAADLGISREELTFAYRYARWIRDRYTVLDLAADLGLLEEWEEEILNLV
ncbi:Glycerol-1-phosphate dehydrogenase [NAD(P)] (EC [Olavius algarvensis associated proteobacterium Delta 3]|nr:Glycerol-1-phosphate dehydrogenase [NAD(P)] (EC [Olavius algarvensis associated proteobacterium Delta 3]